MIQEIERVEAHLHEQRVAEYKAEQERNEEERKAEFERQQQEYEGEQARRKELRDAREARFERVLANPPSRSPVHS